MANAPLCPRMGSVGAAYFNDGYIEDAVKWLNITANAGHGDSAFMLAILNIDGEHLPKNPTQAKKYYKQAFDIHMKNRDLAAAKEVDDHYKETLNDNRELKIGECTMTEEFEEVVFVTDDRDKPEDERMSLRIIQGGNQDWYVSVAPVNEGAINGVRICTSGGAITSHPGLVSAIADAYTALHNAKHGIREHLPSRQELNDELEAWRRKFPGYEFDGLSLREKFEE